LDHTIFLAPMAGITDMPFRLLCKEQGCGLAYLEMVSAKAVFYRNKNTKPLLEVDPQERPVSLQLFGSDPVLIAGIAKQLEDGPYDMFDLNMGCPVPKIVNNGEGSALMKDPKLAGEIVRAVSKAVRKPVTVKIRKGFDNQNSNAVELAKRLEDCGAAAIAVHGRTREQYYSGKADWDVVARVKEAVSIPVIGNGDVDSPESAKKMFEQTGCDAVMVGRGARGNPWIFSQIHSFLETGRAAPIPSAEEVRAMILRHARMEVAFKGEYIGMREMRKHVAWYTSGYPYSAKFRGLVNEVDTLCDLERLLDSSIFRENGI
jgi:nifR3 family TIM-barrel protein